MRRRASLGFISIARCNMRAKGIPGLSDRWRCSSSLSPVHVFALSFQTHFTEKNTATSRSDARGYTGTTVIEVRLRKATVAALVLILERYT